MTSTSDSPGQRLALITGASRGIGRAVAEALLGAGWRVALCSRGEEALRATVDELASSHPDRVTGRAADVRSRRQVEQLASWVESELGPIDCLVNNAGIGAFGAVDELDPDDWDRVVATNLSGAFYTLRAVAPAMRRRGRGWIVNIVSLAGRHPFAGGAAYNASKFGLLGLSDAAMLDLREHGIRVTAVLPGSVATDFSGPGGTGGDWKLAPADVARAVADLLRYPERALPSRLELRPSRPRRG